MSEALRQLVSRGTIENVLLARSEIAGDLSAPTRVVAEAAGSLDTHSSAVDLLGGADTTALSDLSSVLNDLIGVVDPGAAGDVSSQLSVDLSALLTSLF